VWTGKQTNASPGQPTRLQPMSAYLRSCADPVCGVRTIHISQQQPTKVHNSPPPPPSSARHPPSLPFPSCAATSPGVLASPPPIGPPTSCDMLRSVGRLYGGAGRPLSCAVGAPVSWSAPRRWPARPETGLLCHRLRPCAALVDLPRHRGRASPADLLHLLG
jgi:hypothetical protein